MADGSAGFTQDCTCPALLRITLRFGCLRVRGFHPLRPGCPAGSASHLSCDIAVLQPPCGRNRRGLGSSPVARHYWGNHCLFSLPAGTKMFQFPAFASSIRKIPGSLPVGCPIRKSAHQRPFAPPRGLSQLIASFIACKSLGIHRTPFLTCYASFLSLRKESEKRVLKVYFWLSPFRLLYVFIFTHYLYLQECATIRVRFSVFTDLLYSMS